MQPGSIMKNPNILEQGHVCSYNSNVVYLYLVDYYFCYPQEAEPTTYIKVF